MSADASEGARSDLALARRVPLDLLAAVLLAAVSAAVLLGVDVGATLSNPLSAPPGAIAARLSTLAFGLVFLLFLPGYAVVSALFPGHEPAVERLDAEGEPVAPRFRFRSREGIDVVERVTLAIGVSAVLTPGIALAVNFAWGLYAGPLVLAVAGFVAVTSVVAAVRRFRLPPEGRFAPTLKPAPSPLFSGSESAGAANVVLAVGLVVAVAGIGFAVAVPKPGEEFTELYLLDENGTLVADDYPDFVAGEPTPLVVGVENHEGESMTYTMVVELQRVEETENGSSVGEERQLHRSEVSVGAGESERVRVELAPETTGEGLRLRVLLYRGPVPADPSAGSAYRHVDLWVNVTESA